jgi:hypothetical protein
MSDLNHLGWRDKFDKLELDADPGLMPLIVSLRMDCEVMAAAALHFMETEQILADVRRQLMDLIAVRQEHRAI